MMTEDSSSSAMLRIKSFITSLFIFMAAALGVAFILPAITMADGEIPVDELSEDLGIQDPENAGRT